MDVSITFIVVFVAILETARGQIMCFQCSNANDEGCGDIFSPLSPAFFCDKSCLKYRGERMVGSTPVVEVNRLCGKSPDTDCVSGIMYNGILTTRCTCNENRCNHASSLKMHWVLLYLIIATSALIHVHCLK